MVMLSSAVLARARSPPCRRRRRLAAVAALSESTPKDAPPITISSVSTANSAARAALPTSAHEAEEMGYKVLVAEGSPIVMKIIISGYVDAVVGVACLNVLEKAIDKVLLAGVPSMAVPLLSSDCRNTSVDEDWVEEMIHVREENAKPQTPTYLHLLRSAKQLFEPKQLNRLVLQYVAISNCKNLKRTPCFPILSQLPSGLLIAFWPKGVSTHVPLSLWLLTMQ